MKNLLIASSFLIGIILTSCGGGSDNAEIARLREENQALREQLNGNSSTSETETVIEETPQISEAVGNYEITDAKGKKWTLKLNEDDTAVMESNGKTYYGNWEKINYLDDAPHILFPFDDYPEIQFPKTEYLYGACMTIDTNEGYIYGNDASTDTYKSKHPKKRVEIKKIN